VHISYESSITNAKKVMAEEMGNHHLYIDPRSQEDIENGVPRVTVRVLELQENGVLLRGWAWAEDAGKSFVLSCDLYEAIKNRFDLEGIEFAYPHRKVYVQNISNND